MNGESEKKIFFFGAQGPSYTLQSIYREKENVHQLDSFCTIAKVLFLFFGSQNNEELSSTVL
jgi:hypothetical protein